MIVLTCSLGTGSALADAAPSGSGDKRETDVSAIGLWGSYTTGVSGGEIAVVGEKGFTGRTSLLGRAEIGYRSDGSAPYFRLGAGLAYFLVGPCVSLTQTFTTYPSTAFAVGLGVHVPGSLTGLPLSFSVRALHESFLYNRERSPDRWVLGGAITWDFR